MVGGYVYFDGKLYARLLLAALDSEITEIEYPGAYEYFKKIHDTHKLVLVQYTIPEETVSSTMAIIGVSHVLPDDSYMLEDTVTAVGYVVTADSPNIIRKS